MSIIKRLFSAGIALALTFSLGISAAAIDFSDVPENHEYYPAVEFAFNHGISNGVEANIFGIDAQISARVLSIFAIRAFMPEIDDSKAFDVLRDFNCIPDGIEAGDLLDFETGLLILCRTAGIFPTGDDAIKSYSIPAAYRYVRDVGFDLDIMDIRSKISTDPMTRGDAVYVIFAITNWLNSDAAKDLTHVEKYGFGYIDINATEKYADLVPQLASSVICLPFNTLKLFHDMDYQVMADNAHIDTYNQTHKNITAIALFSRGSKTIWTVVGHSLPHEFGHFTQNVIMNDLKSIESCYREEKDNLSPMIPAYAKTNSGEFFAEFFGVYMFNQDDEAALARLKFYMPKTFDYFEKLNESNWVTSRSAPDVMEVLTEY